MVRLTQSLLLILLVALAASCGKVNEINIDREYKHKNEKAFLAYLDSAGYKRLDALNNGGFVLYKVIKEGDGEVKPYYTSSIKVKYEGKTINDYVFDTTFETNNHNGVIFKVRNLISGWQTALQYMTEGERWKVIIPWDLAYGAMGTKDIPPYSTLIFDVELVEIAVQ